MAAAARYMYYYAGKLRLFSWGCCPPFSTVIPRSLLVGESRLSFVVNLLLLKTPPEMAGCLRENKDVSPQTSGGLGAKPQKRTAMPDRRTRA